LQHAYRVAGRTRQRRSSSAGLSSLDIFLSSNIQPLAKHGAPHQHRRVHQHRRPTRLSADIACQLTRASWNMTYYAITWYRLNLPCRSSLDCRASASFSCRSVSRILPRRRCRTNTHISPWFAADYARRMGRITRDVIHSSAPPPASCSAATSRLLPSPPARASCGLRRHITPLGSADVPANTASPLRSIPPPLLSATVLAVSAAYISRFCRACWLRFLPGLLLSFACLLSTCCGFHLRPFMY